MIDGVELIEILVEFADHSGWKQKSVHAVSRIFRLGRIIFQFMPNFSRILTMSGLCGNSKLDILAIRQGAGRLKPVIYW